MVMAPAAAFAAESSSNASETYDLAFTLPTAGVSGCTVCHADPNLVKQGSGTSTSVYVGPEIFAGGPHETTLCTGCHADFAYEVPHENAEGSDAWRGVASDACKGCHQAPAQEISKGAHSPTPVPGVTASETAAARAAKNLPNEVPSCGRCHGSHEIQYLDVERWETSGTVEVQEAAKQGALTMHEQGLEICGSCHVEYADSYEDYYHGAAYQRGAIDAPACWDCHGAHEMLPAENRQSPVNEANLVETCGRCHDDADEQYVQYAELIHGKSEVESEIPLYEFLDTTRSAIQEAVSTVTAWFGGSE